MPSTSTKWHVHPHDPIEKLSNNVWRVVGSVPGMSLRRVMTIVRRDDGDLVLHSAIALEDSAMAEVEAWGTPAYLVVPNAFHRLDAPAYKARYPKMRVYAPQGAKKKVEQVIAVDGSYDDFPTDSSVRLVRLPGLGDREGAMLVQSEDGTTVVITDSVFNMDKKTDFMGRLITGLLGSAPGPRVSRLTKLVMVKDKPAFRRALEEFAEIPDLQRLIVGHEKLASGPDAKAALLKAATFV